MEHPSDRVVGGLVLLQRVSAAANEAARVEAALQVAVEEVCRFTGWPVGHAYVADPRTGRYVPTTAWQLDDPERFATFRQVTQATTFRVGRGLIGRVVAAGAPVWIRDVTVDANFPRAGMTCEPGVRAAFGFPVLVGHEVAGVLEFFAAEPRDPDPELLELLAQVGVQLGRVVERERTTSALAASEAAIRRILATANDAFVTIDAAGVITDWNQQAERLLGWRHDEAVGRPLAETAIPARFRAAHRQGMARFLATGHGPVLGRPVELAALRKDGAEVPVELTIWALDAAEGWRFNAFLRDVTERHQAQAALHASEQRFRQAFAHAPIGMALLSLPLPQPGRFLQVNQALCDLTGQDEATLLASSLTQVTHPADQALCAQALAVLAAGDTDTLVVEQRLLGPDAREVPVRISSSALTDPNGRPAMAVAQIEDRTAARQAMLDPLTGLPNRLLVADRLGHALTRARRRRTHVAVLFMDLDDFKQVNDSLGHAAGDQLLVSVAHRLQRALRASDTAGRLGGDEFVVICEDLADPAEAARLASRIHHDLAAPIDLAGTELIVTASIGIALANPATDPDTAPERLLADADTAMYRAKSRGRARSELYDTQLRSAAATRLALEAELRHAVAAGQLRLHYQPIVELASGRIVGVEALLRWAHPARGLLSPAAFLEVAERTGLIVPMGTWALEQACQQTAAWHHDLPGQPLSVAINLSARQLDHTDLPGQVQRVLDLTGVDPASVCLELTESQLIDTVASPNDELDTLDALKRLGVTLSVDDFGTGYSCLAYLKHLPVDILKIDRCFVAGLGHDPGDAAIVQAILTLAHALGLTCVAEGVETPQQCTRLQQLGCQHSQGHHFLAPQPAEALTTLLAHPPDWHDRS